jgi:hypothetical protein
MKTFRATFALISLFFAGLLVLWWLDYTGVPTERERMLRQDRVLPALMDTPEAAIHRVEISHGDENLVFERRGPGRWQMRKPLDVAAEPGPLENLVRNLKDLRRSADSGTISGAAEPYGLAAPEATIRLWGDQSTGPAAQERPLAVLEIGKATTGYRYVRAAGSGAIDVIDKKLVAGIDRTVPQWREYSLMPVATFQVASLAVHRGALKIQAQRGRGGQWRLTAPIVVPANGAKIESALAALSSVRVVEGAKGFVADNVTDFAPYGLDKPEATIELTTPAQPDGPLVLHVGKRAPNNPDRVYVRRADQDDVALVEARFLSEIPKDSTTFRAQLVTEIEPAAVSEIQIEVKSLGPTFTLNPRGNAWELTSPRTEKADTYLVQSLLNQLSTLKTSEFLDPARVLRPELAPPLMTLKVWQRAANGQPKAAGAATDGPARPPALSLLIGRHDVLKKTVYGRLEGDDVILALPDSLLEVLPKNTFAYRDRGVLELNAAAVTKLTLLRGDSTTVLEPSEAAGAPNQWRMVAPVKAPADSRAVTQLIALLSNLRADEFVADLAKNEKTFGLDQPSIVVSWQLDNTSASTSTSTAASGTAARPRSGEPGAPPGSRLRIGKPVPRKQGLVYAALDGLPVAFTLGSQAIMALVAEFHDTQVLSFPAGSIHRLVLRLPSRALAFTRASRPTGGPTDWTAEPGTDVKGIDLSRFSDLVKQLSQLHTIRFYQYEGPIPAGTGLLPPRLVLELFPADGKPPHVLRLGASLREGQSFAASGTSSSGPVFFLPALAWDALIQSATPTQELPPDVFAPG